MTDLRQLVARLLTAISVLVFVVLLIDVLWGVLTRYAFGHQAPWSEELARLLLVWLSMLGTALAYGQHSHLGVDILLQNITPEARRLAEIAIHAIVLTFVAAVMVYGGTQLFLERLDAGQVMATLPVRKAWMYLAIPTSGAAMTVFAFDSLVSALRGTTVAAPEV